MSSKKNNKIQSIIYALIIIGLVLIAIFVLRSSKNNPTANKNPAGSQDSAVQKEEYIGLQVPPLQSEKGTIDFPYTDENKDETLIIKTDKGTYDSFSNSDIYVSITNTSKNDEKAAVLIYFDEIKPSKENKKPVNPDVKTLEERTGDRWQFVDFFKNNIKLNEKLLGPALAKRQSIPDSYKAKAGTQIQVAAGQTIYLHSKIAFAPGSRGEFWIEAVGANGGYGLLDPWYSSSWSYRKKITINHNKVGGALGNYLNNFPVLISTTDPDLRHTSFGGKVTSSSIGITGGGGDFVFTASLSATPLNYEVEKYASSSGNLLAWVKVASLSATTDTVLYMYYGGPNTGPTNQNKTGVWDANFKGIWHMKEDPSGTAPQMTDSTSNANNGTSAGSMTTSDQVAGQIGNGVDFDGADDLINAQAGSSLANLASISVSAWINPRTAGEGGLGRIVDKTTSTTPTAGWTYALDTVAAFGTRFILDYDGASDLARTPCFAGGCFPGRYNTWQYVTLTWTGGANQSTVHMYFNVTEFSYSSDNAGAGNRVDDSGSSLRIGNESGATRTFDGVIDEVRISNVVRTTDWMRTEYNNESLPGSFESFGGQEVVARTVSGTLVGHTSGSETPPGWYSSGGNNWSYRKKIAIDHTKVGGTLANYLNNFPVLISTTDTDLKHTSFGGKVTSSSIGVTGGGGDFVFTSSNGTTKLNHEIEKYASSSGNLISWVKVASVSATTDTVLYMYYGGPSSGATNQNKTGVWDASFKGIWHMSQTSGDAPDSTDTHTGTKNGTITANSSGEINGAQTLDGTSGFYDTGQWTSASGVTTAEAWINSTTVALGVVKIIANTDNLTTSDFNFELNRTAAKLSLVWANVVQGTSNTSLTANTWYHVAAVRSGSAGNWTVTFYLNGSSDGSATTTSNPNATSPHVMLGAQCGAVDCSSGFAQWFPGGFDEMRVSNIDRSADWIKTEYNNQNSPGTFYAISGQQAKTLTVPQVKFKGGVKIK